MMAQFQTYQPVRAKVRVVSMKAAKDSRGDINGIIFRTP